MLLTGYQNILTKRLTFVFKVSKSCSSEMILEQISLHYEYNLKMQYFLFYHKRSMSSYNQIEHHRNDTSHFGPPCSLYIYIYVLNCFSDHIYSRSIIIGFAPHRP